MKHKRQKRILLDEKKNLELYELFKREIVLTLSLKNPSLRFQVIVNFFHSSLNSDPQYFWNEYLQKWTVSG